MAKSNPSSKKRKSTFSTTKKNSKRKQHLAKISKKGACVRSTWTRNVDKYFKRYLDDAFKTSPALHPGLRPDMHILRLTASRVYKTFIPAMQYNKNIQYPHKDVCVAAEEDVLDIFLKNTRWTVFRPGTIVHPEYFFMSCIPDAIIKNRKEVCLVEIKTRLKKESNIIEGQVEKGLDKLKNRWWHQVQFSLHVCNLKKCFLLFYDADSKEIFEKEVIEREEEYLSLHLDRFVTYFVERIFLEKHPLNKFLPSFREKGIDILVRRVWDEMAKNHERLQELAASNMDHFKIFYDSLPFTSWK